MLHKVLKNIKVDDNPRHRFLPRRGFLAGITAFAATFTLTPFSPTHAAPFSSLKALAQVNRLNESDAQKYISAVVSSSQYQQFKQQTQSQYAGIFTFQEQNAVAWAITTSQSTSTAVRIPIDGGAGKSFYIANFSTASMTIADTQSGLFVQMPNKNIHTITTVNSQQVLDAIITPEGNFVSGTAIIRGKQTNLDRQSIGVVLSSLNAASQTPLCCLENALLTYGFASAPLILDAALICTAVCVGTLGGGCLPCIGVAIGIEYAGCKFVEGQCDANPNRYSGVISC